MSNSHDASYLNAVEIAMVKARELGYPVGKMKVTFFRTNGVCTTYFETMPESGHAVLGGDLTVNVELRTLKIVGIERGQ